MRAVEAFSFWAIVDRRGYSYPIDHDNSTTAGIEQYKISNYQQGSAFFSDQRLTRSVNSWGRPVMETSEFTGLYRFP
jgi:hypothetical protein